MCILRGDVSEIYVRVTVGVGFREKHMEQLKPILVGNCSVQGRLFDFVLQAMQHLVWPKPAFGGIACVWN